MIMISVKEAALLKGCSEQFLRKLALNGQIHTVTERTKNGRMSSAAAFGCVLYLGELNESLYIIYHKR